MLDQRQVKPEKMIFDVLQSVDNYKILDLFAGAVLWALKL